jgi:hypothetical protein
VNADQLGAESGSEYNAEHDGDNFGDLGNGEKIKEAYSSFSTAVTAIGSLVAERP